MPPQRQRSSSTAAARAAARRGGGGLRLITEERSEVLVESLHRFAAPLAPPVRATGLVLLKDAHQRRLRRNHPSTAATHCHTATAARGPASGSSGSRSSSAIAASLRLAAAFARHG